jgi:hypothetical protein
MALAFFTVQAAWQEPRGTPRRAARWVEVWRRNGAEWAHATHGAGEKAPLPSIGYELDVDALYDASGVA